MLEGVINFRNRSIGNFLLLIVFFNLPYFASAQKFSFGVKATGSMNWVSFGDKEAKDVFSRKLKYGYGGAIIIGFPLSKNYNFITEGGFSQKGRVMLFNKDVWENNATYQFIDMTMLLRRTYKFYIAENIPSEWFFNIGPEISYWLNGKGYITAGGPKYPYDIVFNGVPDGSLQKMYLNETNRWLFGLALGVGFTAPMRNNHKITTELRFVSGHTYLRKTGGFDSNDFPILGFEDTLKTNLKSLNLSIAYVFEFDVKGARKGKSTLNKKLKKSR